MSKGRASNRETPYPYPSARLSYSTLAGPRSPEERQELELELEKSFVEADAGELVDAEVLLAELRGTRIVRPIMHALDMRADWVRVVSTFALVLGPGACANNSSAPVSAANASGSAADGSEEPEPAEPRLRRERYFRECVEGCHKIQQENPDETPYDCTAQCKETIDSIRSEE